MIVHETLSDKVREIAAKPIADQDVLRKVVELIAEAKPRWNWVGIYLLVEDKLKLGPYVGKPTDHTVISIGAGVCGTAVAEDRNIIVDDVRALDNYIACSLETRSEIVVLIRHNGKVVAQFDMDSDDPAAFTPEDERELDQLAPLVAAHCARVAKALGKGR